MIEPWIGWTIGILFVSIALLFALWLWRGVWLALNKGQMYARTRWHWYVRTSRWARRTFRIQYAQAALGVRTPMHASLTIPKSNHGQRIKIERRRKRGQSTK